MPTSPVTAAATPHAVPNVPSSADPVASLFGEGGLAEAWPTPLVALGPDGTTIGWNRAAEELFGWSADEVLGRDVLPLIAELSTHQFVRDLLREVLAGNPPQANVGENYTRDGRTIVCEWHNAVVRDRTGAPLALVGIARDITREHRAAREQERLREIAAAANASREVDEILRMVRCAVAEVGGFDRAGIWLVRDGMLCGSWGTDVDGNMRDERSLRAAPDDQPPALQTVMRGSAVFVVSESPLLRVSGLDRAKDFSDPTYGAIGLRARGEFVGVVMADNMPSGRPLREEQVAALAPFCEQAAVAISNAELLQERHRMLERQRRIVQASSAISLAREPLEVLRLLRDALTESSGFDRAGIWFLEGDNLRGSWGTDDELQLRDERNWRIPLAEFAREPLDVLEGRRPYVIQWERQLRIPGQERFVPAGPIEYATIALRADDQVTGIVFVDNLVTRRPVRAEDVEAFQPLCEQAAIALSNARLLAERQDNAERQRRLMELAAAINHTRDLNQLLRLVRDALVDVGGFDRAGVFTFESGMFQGSWGTAPDGTARDESHYRFPLAGTTERTRCLVAGQGAYYIEDAIAEPMLDGRNDVVVRRVVIALRAGGELVGAISADNLLTWREFDEHVVEALLPFAEHAAVAIRNARLIAERERLVERQRRLATVAAAISARTDLTEVLRIIHAAIREAAGFDRSAVFLLDRERRSVIGTWGTDRQGQTVDISGVEIDLEEHGPRPLRRVLWGEIDYWLTDDLTAVMSLEPGNDQYGVRHHAVVPLRAGSEILGAIAVDNLLRDAPITQDDIAMLLPFAEQAAVAIQNARAFEDLDRAQAALVRSEKLRALGELAGGVAHNINNLLTAVLGYAEMIQEDENATATIEHYARIVERAALDGAEIVRRVQQFASKETSAVLAPIDLAELAQQAIDLTRPAWQSESHARGARLEVAFHAPAAAPSLGVASEIREVIVNLIKNAVDAMPEGGALTVRCHTADSMAIVEVQDTGTGMDEETRSRVFEPFFTTKGHTLGTGLGLSVAWGITVRHNGRLDVASEPGRGTTFTLALPAVEWHEGASRTRRGIDDRLDGVRVMIVEDEDFVCESLARMLIHRGAEVNLAASGDEALVCLGEHSGAFDVVISDHGMPGMTGAELLGRIRVTYPAVRRILLSGWGAEPPGDVDMRGVELALGKPVRQHELVRAVARLVHGKVPQAEPVTHPTER